MRSVRLRLIRIVTPPLFILMGIPGLNSKVLDKIIGTLGLQSAVEKLPTTLAPTIQPVLIANPDEHVNIVAVGSTSTTLYSVPEGKKFFITDLSITSTSKELNATDIDTITVTLESGESVVICSNVISSTATNSTNNTICMNLSRPLQIKTGTNITASKNSSTARFVVMGFLIDII